MPCPARLDLLRGSACLLAWWWLMMAVHELGHVLGCLVTGARIEAVILWPWTISATLRSGSHHPRLDTWAGRVIGALLPLTLWLACRRRSGPGRWPGGWAGFCLVANGVYLGAGWIDLVGDAGDLRRLGTPVWALVGSGVIGVGTGLLLWHHLLAGMRREAAGRA
jgi:hypothetical protein